MDAHFHPRLINRSRYDTWKDAGAQDLYTRCNAEAKKILSKHAVEPKPAGVLGEIENILEPKQKTMVG
jgi:trimethylamine:corrinoid methyltransferase-like protein